MLMMKNLADTVGTNEKTFNSETKHMSLVIELMISNKVNDRIWTVEKRWVWRIEPRTKK